MIKERTEERDHCMLQNKRGLLSRFALRYVTPTVILCHRTGPPE